MSREVVWAAGKARLYHYKPGTAGRFPVPILLIHALILRPYILDLIAGNSFVEYLATAGFDVYLLDWGVPDVADAHRSLVTYILEDMPAAVECVLQTAQAEAFTLVGYCMGGTMSALYAALFPGKPLKNLVLLAAPIDCALEAMGLSAPWMLLMRYRDPDLVVRIFGNFPADLPGRLMAIGTSMLKPIMGGAGGWLWRPGEWLSHSWPYASGWMMACLFRGPRSVSDFYQRNRLVKGELWLRGRRVHARWE